MNRHFYRSFFLSLIALFACCAFPCVSNASTSPATCDGGPPWYLTCDTALPATNNYYNKQPVTTNIWLVFNNPLTEADVFEGSKSVGQQEQFIPYSEDNRILILGDSTFYYTRVTGCCNHYLNNGQHIQLDLQPYTTYGNHIPNVQPTRFPAIPRNQTGLHTDWFFLFNVQAQVVMAATFVAGFEDSLKTYFTDIETGTPSSNPDMPLHQAIQKSVGCLTTELNKLLEDWNVHPDISDSAKSGDALNWGAEAGSCITQDLEAANPGSLSFNNTILHATEDILNAGPAVPSGTYTTFAQYVTSRLQSNIINALTTILTYPSNNTFYQHLLDRVAIFFFAVFSSIQGFMFTYTLSSTLA